MVGGENQLVKAKLTPRTFTVNSFKRDIQNFAAGYKGEFTELSRSDDLFIDKVLETYEQKDRGSTKDSVIEALDILNKTIVPNETWFRKDDVALLCAKLFDHWSPTLGPISEKDIQNYKTYGTELQQLLSIIEKQFMGKNAETINRKLEDMWWKMHDMYYGIATMKNFSVSSIRKNYFDSAPGLVRFLIGAVRVFKAMGMI